jgi:signal transduction histidine kinase
LTARLIRAQEVERARLARELHDDTSQRLLLLTIELESATRSDNAEGLGEALTLAKGISTSLRQLSHQLHPARLRVIGLVSALESLCAELSHAGVPVAFTYRDVPPQLPADAMLCLFRVAQEGLQNALKHSRATELGLNLTGTPDGLMLTIVDNGIGFDVDGAWGRGVGLGSMSERLQDQGGALTLVSRPGEGTRIVATLPQQSCEPPSR